MLLSKKRAAGLLLTYIYPIKKEIGFMRNYFVVTLSFLLMIFTSCSLVNEIVPDVNTDYSKAIKVQIFTNSGESGDQIIDVSTSEQYNDFKNNIGGFELRKITYEINNVNTPEDMYFNGNVICSNEEKTEIYTIGSMEKGNLIALEAQGEKKLASTAENVDKVLGWLDSPGRFKLKSSYILTNQDGSPYPINGLIAGSNFELVIKLYVTVKTKI